MNDEEPLLGTSLLRGILLLGAVGLAGYGVYVWWKKSKAAEKSLPPKTVSVPITIPTLKKKK